MVGGSRTTVPLATIRRRPRVWLALLAVVAACGDPAAPAIPAGLDLRVEQEDVLQGQQLAFRLVNETDGDLGYHLCDIRLQRWSGVDGWIDVPAFPEDYACTLALYVLPAGQSLDASFQTFSWMEPGLHRLAIDVAWITQSGAPRVRLRSRPFRIVQGPLRSR